MNTLDINKNGFIDYTEFLAGCMKSKIYLKDENLRRAFEYFDKVIINILYTLLHITTFPIITFLSYPINM